jgi:TPR repeat protein
MRRRDEPKLDDLKKLLRRLENIEVDSGRSGGDSAHERGSQSGGYVGALRGAPAPTADEPEDDRSRGEFGASPYRAEASEQSAGKPRSSGMASIVIGAATAAIVSSLAAVAVLLLTGGQGAKVGPDSRVPVNAPKLPALGAPMGSSQAGAASIYTPSAAPDSALSGDDGTRIPAAQPAEPTAPAPQSSDVAEAYDVASLERRAGALIRGGSLTEARQLLERAAGLGSGAAALTLGATYDPARMAEFGRLGARADPNLARTWYERARALGAIEANARITELAKK